MKYPRYIAVVLIVLAILAGAVHVYRESIAREIANSALGEQGITATELSIETLATDHIRLSYLVLEQDDGTRYEISGLSFPLSFPSFQPETISIEQLVLVPAPAKDEPLPLAQLLQTFLQLPVSVPNTEITVSSFSMPDAPPVDHIVWRSEGRQQHFAFSIDRDDIAIAFTIDVDGPENGDHAATVNAAVDGNADALSLALTMHRDDTGFAIDALPNFNLSRWLPVLDSAGLLPDDIVAPDVEVHGPITIILNDDATLPVTAGLRVSLEVGPLRLGTVTFGSTKVSASLTITLGETTEIDISPELDLVMNNIEAQSFAVAAVSATRFSGVQLTTDNDGWRGDIDHLELAFDSLSDRAGLIASAPLTLNTIRLGNNAATIEADISISPNAAAISWDGTGIEAPGIEGHVSLQNDRVATTLALANGQGGVAARVDASHDLATAEGSVTVSDAVFQFGQTKLSGFFLQWPHVWDIVAGTWTTDLKIDWNIGDDRTEYNGTMTHQVRALSGNYNDYAFTGLRTTLSGDVDSATGVSLSPSSIEVELFDAGLPLKQITADFTPNVEQQALQVQNLSMSVLGGKLVADPFRFSMQEETNDIILRPQSIQLQFMAALAEFENIELSGSLSGALPVTIHNEVITIANGRLESDAPGGVIRYLPGAAAEGTTETDSGIGLVSRALANFQFDSLTSDVNYMENGDLMLQMKLTGVNPDMDANQPVILNLGVENNIPQLLRSLRASRSIEEILERRSGN